jgi:hypothetical protein
MISIDLIKKSKWCQCGKTFAYAFVSNTYCSLACSGNILEKCGGGANPTGPYCASVFATCKLEF